MADTVKVLGQSIPSAGTLTALYTVPASTSAVISSLVICNTANSATAIRVSVAVAGAADTTSQYIYYDLPIAANDTFVFTGGISLAATDVIRVRSVSGSVVFSLYGVQIV